jgi:PgaA membrane beta barrel domain
MGDSSLRFLSCSSAAVTASRQSSLQAAFAALLAGALLNLAPEAALADSACGLQNTQLDSQCAAAVAAHTASPYYTQALSGLARSDTDRLVNGEYVYTHWVERSYQAYVHLDQTQGGPSQGMTYRHAADTGLEYHSSDWPVRGESLEIDHGGPHLQVTIQATPGDYWKPVGSYATRTLAIPTASIVVSVYADRTAFLNFRASESRDFGAQVIREQYDDNLSSEWLIYWHERWIRGPIYELDSRVDLDTSRDTLGNDYLNPNPKRDFSAVVTLENQWLQFRRGNVSLKHEVDIGVGSYLQHSYGSGAMQTLQYLLVYETGRHLTLKLGGGLSIRPVDGQRQHLGTVVCNVSGRF